MYLAIQDIRKFFETNRRRVHNDKNLIPAGVLIPIFEQNDELCFVLTQRTEEVEHHKGQISFPGGTKDLTDATIIDTALREAEEEIGLQRNVVEVLGLLDDFPTPSGFCITPVAAFLKSYSQFIINTTEVAKVFSVPLALFLDSSNEHIEQHKRAGKIMDVYFYHYGDYKIWGATAAIIHSFLKSLVEKRLNE